MAVDIYHRQDDEYARWRAAHPDGYVLNVGRDGPVTLHRATCRHLPAAGSARRGTPTGVAKACSTDRGELEAWGRAVGRRVLRCAACDP